ncbi:MAG: hypothetical protein B7Z10_02850 [Rhodobacterales bacterium 32-66-7]|nr:MAG: hypothetical protein B7Z10_02850 [Rhodobacterales bacterium 32-66-7]
MDLSRLIEQFAQVEAESLGGGQMLPGLTLFRRTARSGIEALLYEPVICLILQGRKDTWIGDQSVSLGPGDALVVSHDLPVQSRITLASPQTPYLAVILTLDLAVLRGLQDELAGLALPASDGRSLAVTRAEPALLQALSRYLDLSPSPLDARVLGPGVLREVQYRLLLSPAGAMLRRLIVSGSHASRIAQAIQRLRQEFHLPLGLPDLARSAGMSVTSFHQHFKAITGTTPLQYQKDLRLIAARALLVDRAQSVAEAAYATGYESATHFSHDYRRRFGRPPSRDAARDRAAPVQASGHRAVEA